MATESISNVVPQLPPPEMRPNVDHLVTEDDTPVDNFFSEKQQRLLVEPLHSSWSGPEGGRGFVAAANVGLFFAVREPPYVPDMMLSLDVRLPEDLWPKSNRSYFVWEYGKPPDVVIEVVSNREGGEDSTKLAGYARIGIRYYVIYDPDSWLSDQSLRAFQLEGMTYQRLQEPVWLPGVGLGLCLWPGKFEDHENTWLRWIDGEGNVIPTGSEHLARERQRAEKLAEQLRRLGVEPEA